MRRRDFLRASSSIAASALLATVIDTSTNSSATPDLVEELARRLVRLRKLDNHLGGADTYHLYAAEAELSAHVISGGTHQSSIHRSLLGIYAEQSQQAGWAAFDAGWHDTAKITTGAATQQQQRPGILVSLGMPWRSTPTS